MSQPIEIIKFELISIGKVGFIESESPLISFYPYGSSEAYHIYDMLYMDALTDNDLIQLFKGLVISEKELSWNCGSTTPAAHVYQHIKLRNLDTEHTLADWAFQYSDNEYIPFGFRRHGEKTAYEYIQWRENRFASIAQEQIDAKNKKANRLKREQEILQNKRQTDAKVRNLYQKIMSLPPNVQIQTILNDCTHNILFYLPIIYGLMHRSDVLRKDWGALLRRLSQLKDTPFKIRLIKNISSKLHNE